MKKIRFLLLILLGTMAIQAQAGENAEKIQIQARKCYTSFQEKEQKCPDTWSMKCYNYLLSAHKDTQECYKKIATALLRQFYDLSASEAENKFDEYDDFIHRQYLFIFNDSTYCKQNNCGVSPYLYSEYAATQNIQNYVDRIIQVVSHEKNF